MSKITSIDIVGAGPAGLYAAILIRRRLPEVRVRVFEKNPRGATFGFGVVFSDRALDFMRADDAETCNLITRHMEQWRNMTLNLPQGSVVIDGVGFSSIGRLKLLEILYQRARSLDLQIEFDSEIDCVTKLDADLVVGADGLNSIVRQSFEAEFRPVIDYSSNHFVWLGTARSFDTLTQTFVETEMGAFNAHHYRYQPDRSTFIVECDDATYRAYGFNNLSVEESSRICESVFAEVLQGGHLIRDHSHWRQFPRLWCEKWHHDRFVLLGDAAHTAHFSIGSGTRLAMEDATALVWALTEYADLSKALAAYRSQRQPVVKKIVDAANSSASWYESFADRLNSKPLDFAFDYLTRSGRVDMDRLRRMSPAFMACYEAANDA